MLYHIPQMAGIGWSLDLVGRLRAAFPGLIAGLKDSAGAFDYTKAMIDAFPGFAVFPGAEVYLVKALQSGAAGCISASANINARGIRGIYDYWKHGDAAQRQEAANAIRKAVEGPTMIASVKAVLAARYGDPGWLVMRPPLVRVNEEARAALVANPAIAGLLEAVAA
jgi:4-hydroxy-tetrahydrodipicolinate synthase